MSAITDIQFNNGKIIVAGLSNEEFASKLRVLDYPFGGEASDSSIEIYHGAHGKLETRSPVRTFITYENTVLAAYTCTPLVSIPVEDLNGDGLPDLAVDNIVGAAPAFGYEGVVGPHLLFLGERIELRVLLREQWRLASRIGVHGLLTGPKIVI